MLVPRTMLTQANKGLGKNISKVRSSTIQEGVIKGINLVTPLICQISNVLTIQYSHKNPKLLQWLIKAP